MKFKNKLEDYTEVEFLDFLNKIWAVSVSSEDEHDELVEQFSKVTEHPDGNGLIFYPKAGVEYSPEGVIKEIKEWRLANGRPGFKEV